MQQKNAGAVTFLAAVFAGAGLFLALSLARHLAGDTGMLAAAGAFLFSSFLWSAFFVPAFLLLLCYFLVARRFRPGGVLVLTLLLGPFFTVSLFHRVVLAGSIPAALLPELLVEVFGKTAAGLLLFLLLLVELFVILRVSSALRSSRRGAAARRGPGSGAAQAGAPRAPAGSSRGRPARRERRVARGAARPAGRAEASAAKRVRGLLPEAQPLAASGADGPAGAADGRPGAAAEAAGYRWVEDAQFEVEAGQTPPGDGLSGQTPPAGWAEPTPADSPPEAAAGLAAVRGGVYGLPVAGLLKDYADGEYWQIDEDTRGAAKVLMSTLEEFKISAEVTGIRKGPVITMFEVLPSPGVKISRIVALSDNIALRLAASRVRIVAPIPGKHAVGIEVPNRKRAIVSFKEMVTLEEFQKSHFEIPIALGKDIAGDAQIVDLTQTPHLLIAGATGSGKSVCVNSIICSMLYRKSPQEVRFILIDPKIVELKAYNDIPHLLTPVVTEAKRIFQVLQYCLSEMERRYAMLDRMGVRDIRSYNRKVRKQRLVTERLPYWVIVIDEFADLIATTGKEMEAIIARLAAMARAVGLHLVLATQRPSIEVITGLIKANIPSRVAFMVASKFDSRIIIDTVGAEKLLGQGDMLFAPAWDPVPVRIQGAFLSEEEVEAITEHARTLGEPEYLDEEIFYDEEEGEFGGLGSDDPLMDKALEIVVASGKASASYLQRRLKIGYNRAARLVEEMEMRGIVGPAQGSKPREILHLPER